MEIDIELVKKIYMQLGDERSKQIFKNRLMYSITGDTIHLMENLNYVSEGADFLKKLKQCILSYKMVIFGSGMRGKNFYQLFSKCPWKYFVDNYSVEKQFDHIPVISCDKFLSEYEGEYVFITPKLENEVIYEQLVHAGIPIEKIINVGKIQNELIKRQYFDLEYLKPKYTGEVFVDAGGYDGMTSIYFDKWCHGNGFCYIFEPDTINKNKCIENLTSSNIKYQIISKGVWSEETTLNFQANAGIDSNISKTGNSTIQVTTIDEALKNENVSFIKMDIEGAELQALVGAKRTIANDTPKLAISIYHKLEDIWEIPDIILQYNPSYKLYLRHYSLTGNDTVLYALP